MIAIARAEGSSSVDPERFHERWVDLDSHPEWSAGMEFLRLSEPMRLGARGILKARTGEPTPFVVTELVPGRIYADTTLLDGARLTVRHEARPGDDGHGARLAVTAALDGPAAEDWAVRMGDSVQQDLAADLASLTRLLEWAPSPATPYPLVSERLRIEPLTGDDVSAFVAYRRVPEIARWQSWTPDYSEDDARALVAGQPATALPSPGHWLQLAIRDTSDGRLLGDVAIHSLLDQPDTYELGITMATAGQGHGFATEAVRRVLDFLFRDRGAHRVVAFGDARNRPVARLLIRTGFRHESRQVEADWFKGEWTTLDGFAVLAHEYPAPADES